MARKAALIIGNSQYQDLTLAKLKAPDADVRGLTELLEHPKMGQFNEVVPLINESEAATRRAIASFFARAAPDDMLLLYFSGHGVLDDKGRLYLAACDTQRDLPQATAISAAFITDAMDSSRSRRQVLILDCCHSGAFARGARAVGEAKAVTAATFEGVGYGRAVLTATDATQYAWEGEAVIGSAENSVFTHCMIEGLKTGAADVNQDGEITLEELYTYVYSEVVRRTPRQTPRKWSYNQEGEFVIARNPRPIAPPSIPLPDDLQHSIDDLRPWVREGALLELERLLFGNTPGLAESAHAALQKLRDDDSRRISMTAAALLARYEAERQPAASGSSPPAAEPIALAGAPLAGEPAAPSPPSPAGREAAAGDTVGEAPPRDALARPTPAVRVPQLAAAAAGLTARVQSSRWLAVAIIAVGWALGRGLAQVVLPADAEPQRTLWLVNWLLGGVAGGFLTGLAMIRLEPGWRPRHAWQVAAGWAVAWTLMFVWGQLAREINAAVDLGAPDPALDLVAGAAGGAVGGYLMGLAWRAHRPGLARQEMRWLVSGWALSWGLGGALVHLFADPGWSWAAAWAVSALIAGAVGGAAVLRVAARAQARPDTPGALPSAMRLRPLDRRQLALAAAVIALGWGLAFLAGGGTRLLYDAVTSDSWPGLYYPVELLGSAAAGAVGGWATGLVLRRLASGSNRPQPAAMAALWALALAASSMLIAASWILIYDMDLDVAEYLPTIFGLALAGAIAGYLMAKPWAWDRDVPGRRQTLLVAGAWATAFAVAVPALIVLPAWLGTEGLVNWALAGLVCGAIGGTASLWVLAQAGQPRQAGEAREPVS
jgi:hypothetical protein